MEDREFPRPEEHLSASDEFSAPRPESEFDAPSPETEFSAPAGTDYENPPANAEFTPPGGGGSGPPRRTGRLRKLRRLLYAAAALALIGLLFAKPDGGETTTIYSSASDVSPWGGERVEGAPYLNIVYAVLPAEDQNTVHYCYVGAPCATDPSVEAYVSVSDSAGGAVQSPNNPEIWEHSRDRQDDTIDVSSLAGEELVLTVTIRYDAGGGVEKEISQSRPVSRLSPEPELFADLEVYVAGGGRRVNYIAKFLPQEGDRHHYELEVESFLLNTYDLSGNMVGGHPFGDWDGPLESRMPGMGGSDAEGYVFSFVGPYPGEHISGAAEYYTAVLELRDLSTGYYYTVETEKALISDLPELTGGAPQSVELSSTEFDCALVFFNFSAYHHGFVKMANQDEVVAGTVEIWEKNLESLEWSHELTAEEIASGYYELPEFDDADTYFSHMDYYAETNGMPEMELRVTLTLEGEDGTRTVEYRREASHEQGWGVGYWPEDYKPSWDWQECYPGCFAVMSYESLDGPVYMQAGGYEDALASGKICVELSIDGVPVPTDHVMVITREEPIYTEDGEGNYVPTGKTLYYATVVIERPSDAPPSGTAEFTVCQKLSGYDLVWTTHKVIEY